MALINAITLPGSEHALTAVTLEMAKASELSTAQLLAQPRSFLKLNFAFSRVKKYIFPTYEMNCSKGQLISE